MNDAIQDVSPYFFDNYHQARKRLLQVCRGRDVESFVYNGERAADLRPTSSGQSNALALDAVWLGDPASSRLFVFSSGLHGVEGRFGSACQLAAIDQGRLHELALREGWAALVLHALNPFGYANDRRWDEQNIDANRNFLLPNEQADLADNRNGANRVYHQLTAMLNPSRPPSWHDRITFYISAISAIRKHGYSQVKQAIAEGQYVVPAGLFYGGAGPCWTNRILQANLPRWVQDRERVIHIDVHSGLGEWGNCKLLMDFECREWQAEWMKRHPTNCWEQVDPKGTAYNARGGLGRWCNTTFTGHQYLYLCAEVGTYHPLRVLRTLRLENQAWRHLNARPPGIVRELREMFCPTSPGWRHAAVNGVWAAILRSIQQRDD